jgi:hypothetical protein
MTVAGENELDVVPTAIEIALGLTQTVRRWK